MFSTTNYKTNSSVIMTMTNIISDMKGVYALERLITCFTGRPGKLVLPYRGATAHHAWTLGLRLL